MIYLVKDFLRKIIFRIRGEVDTESLIRSGLTVGKNFSRQGGVIIDPPHCWLISIGDNVTLASRVYILAHDASTKMHTGYTKVGNVSIGNNVFVGANSTILPNVKIGNNVVIGAGSVVSRDIPDNSVAVGNPAEVVAKTQEFVDKNENLMKNRPVWDFDWTIHRGISNEKRKIMREKLKDGIGFVE
ncbi:acyltransferase [Priestia sp. YIM B13489]|uniref:acyltransferase n=1 Tax=Priestia sp. YIM B13489 TaxID=3366313 RepID=UPI00366AC52F